MISNYLPMSRSANHARVGFFAVAEPCPASDALSPFSSASSASNGSSAAAAGSLAASNCTPAEVLVQAQPLPASESPLAVAIESVLNVTAIDQALSNALGAAPASAFAASGIESIESWITGAVLTLDSSDATCYYMDDTVCECARLPDSVALVTLTLTLALALALALAHETFGQPRHDGVAARAALSRQRRRRHAGGDGRSEHDHLRRAHLGVLGECALPQLLASRRRRQLHGRRTRSTLRANDHDVLLRCAPACGRLQVHDRLLLALLLLLPLPLLLCLGSDSPAVVHAFARRRERLGRLPPVGSFLLGMLPCLPLPHSFLDHQRRVSRIGLRLLDCPTAQATLQNPLHALHHDRSGGRVLDHRG